MKFIKLILILGFLLRLNTVSAQEAYKGSSFNEVMNVITDNHPTLKSEIENQELNYYQNGALPKYKVNWSTLFSFGGAVNLEKDALRTVSQRNDYYDRIPKKLHPNGICVSGKWIINQQTPYSGYFANSSKGLFIGRITVAMEDTTSENSRGFGFAGKIFPTLNENETVTTGNFFTVDVLMGTNLTHVMEAKTTNEPEIGFKWSLLALGLKISSALKTADENPGFRPLTQIANLGITGTLRQPHWIRISAQPLNIKNNELDFRNEILKAMSDNKTLVYNIDVSDSTKDRNASVGNPENNIDNNTKGWTQIGVIELNKALVSYGCDRRLHFAHPKLN